MIIKRNRGRQWLDWERRMVTGAYYGGVAACLLMLIVLVFGDMGLSRYFSMREHAQQLDVDLQELQRIDPHASGGHRSRGTRSRENRTVGARTARLRSQR